MRPRGGWGAPELRTLAERLRAAPGSYETAIRDCLGLADWAATIARTDPQPGQPCWENDWWGSVDALVQCGALRRRNPALYIEVGSGFSTRFARRAIRDFGLRTRIVSVDPSPRADVEASCDESVRAPLEELDLSLFDRLGPGDMLLIDSSHTALMNSDATVLFLEVLPRLAAGVLVGVDDVFLPWDYPPTWGGRAYGEQYLLAAFLLGGGGDYRIHFPGWWLIESSPLATSFEPLWATIENRFGRRASCFWLERDPPPPGEPVTAR
jgi:hypothetical protein